MGEEGEVGWGGPSGSIRGVWMSAGLDRPSKIWLPNWLSIMQLTMHCATVAPRGDLWTLYEHPWSCQVKRLFKCTGDSPWPLYLGCNATSIQRYGRKKFKVDTAGENLNFTRVEFMVPLESGTGDRTNRLLGVEW